MDKKVLAGGAVFLGAAFWFYVKPNYLDAAPPPVYTEEQIAAAPKPTLTLDQRVINLKAPATAPNYVKAEIAIEFNDPEHKYIGLKGEALVKKNEEFEKEIEHELPKVLDIITSIIGSKTIDEVSTPEGRERLKTTLVEAINKELHGEQKVEKVYFVTFITQ